MRTKKSKVIQGTKALTPLEMNQSQTKSSDWVVHENGNFLLEMHSITKKERDLTEVLG